VNEQQLVDSFWCFGLMWALLTIHIWVMQDLLFDIKRKIREDFDDRHWDEAEDFIESELNLLGIRTVSDLEDDKEDE
jgi:hypothetical protein